MASAKYLVIAVLACVACAVVGKPNGMVFDLARDYTVCRTRVKYDTDEDRIPKIIKMIKCEDDPYEMCPAGNGKSVPCCGALPLAGGTKFSCTEVQDVVKAKKVKTGKEYPLSVSIGCSCIKEIPNKAKE